jgi:hypothetical protein
MASTQHSKIVQQALEEKQVLDISGLTDTDQLEIYHLALLKIKERAERHIPRSLPFETLKDSEEALNELSIDLVYLGMKPVGKSFHIEDDVLPKIEEALSYVTQAISIRERVDQANKKEDLPRDYFDCVIRFRRLVIQSYEYLRES